MNNKADVNTKERPLSRSTKNEENSKLWRKKTTLTSCELDKKKYLLHKKNSSIKSFKIERNFICKMRSDTL